MGFEEARQAMETPAQQEPKAEPSTGRDTGVSAAPTDNGDLAPDSASTEASNVIDLTKAEKFLWEGKEMTPDELRKSMLFQKDYTKKTQTHAEERRKFEEERTAFVKQQEETEKYETNLDIDIQNVLKDPSLEAKFKEIYPPKYHSELEKSLTQAFGDRTTPDSEVKSLKQQVQTLMGRFQSQDQERAAQAFESEVKANAEVLDSAVSRLSTKYPSAIEDIVLARAEYLSAGIKKDENFSKNFTQMMDQLYKENHQEVESLLATKYKAKVEQQKQANVRGKDIGVGGATPGAAPTKLKLKDVKNHIISTLEQ